MIDLVEDGSIRSRRVVESMKLPVYLDNHATTRVDPRVLDAMLPYYTERFGNAASRQHEYGWDADAAVEKARAQVAGLIGAGARDIVFTAGATESINLAIKGVAEAYRSRGNHIITAATEHRAVLDTCRRLETYGFDITYLPVDEYGRVHPSQIAEAITGRTILVSIMAANNEIGTLAPIREIASICRERGILFHTDATQAAGKVPVDVTSWKADLLSLSAHKMYGPKGIGALFVKSPWPGPPLAGLIDGGGHERGLISGTLNVPAIVGFGEAASIARDEMSGEAARVGLLRDMLVNSLQASLEGVHVNGHPTEKLPNNANITFAGMRADRLMMDMKDLAVSSGSACSSASPEPSHVLRAIGLQDDAVHASLRFGLGRFTTGEEIEYAIARIVQTVRRAGGRPSDVGHGTPKTTQNVT